MGTLRLRVEAEWFALDRLVHTLVSVPRRQLIDRIVYDESDPRWRKHVIDEVVLMEAPVVAHLADLHSLQVVIIAHKRVHVAVETLQVVDGRRVELDFDEVFRICYMEKERIGEYMLSLLISLILTANDKVNIVPIRK